MNVFPILLAILGIVSAPRPLPDLAQCRLSHGFVLGPAWNHPGAIEIWDCPRQTVVTLTQFLGTRRDLNRRLSSHFAMEVGADEKLVGCRNEDWSYSGIVALTASADTPALAMSRAWRADLERWELVEIPLSDFVCNRGLPAD